MKRAKVSDYLFSLRRKRNGLRKSVETIPPGTGSFCAVCGANSACPLLRGSIGSTDPAGKSLFTVGAQLASKETAILRPPIGPFLQPDAKVTVIYCPSAFARLRICTRSGERACTLRSNISALSLAL